MLLLAALIALAVTELAFWKIVAGTVITAGAVVGALATLHAKVVSPWIAKPLAKQLRKELREEVREIILEPETIEVLREALKPALEEVYATESKRIINLLTEVLDRLQTVEDNQRSYMKKAPARTGAKGTGTGMGTTARRKT